MNCNKLKTLLLFAVIFSVNLNAQNRSIQVANAPSSAALMELEGEKTNEIDSVFSANDTFTFSMEGKHPGLYRLRFDHMHFINFIYDGEDVEIKSDFNNISDSLKVIKSESNKLYYKFIRLNKAFKTKTELLNVILQRYPKDDDYYETTLKKFEALKYEYSFFVNVTSQKEPESFIARYVRSSQLPLIDGTLSFEEQVKYLKSHALDNVDFNDDELTYSDCFSNKSIEYLMYYRNPQAPKGLLEKEFMRAVDTLLMKARKNIFVYQHIAEYLIDGFKKFGFNNIVDYVIENYVIKDDLCLDEKLGTSLQNRIDQAQKLKIGNVVPNIILPDTSGNEIDLSKLKSEKILILFYASWCPHCQEIVPEIFKLYDKQKEKKIDVLAVSLDEKRVEWIKFIKDNNLNWLNVSDLKGWSGKAASDYYIYATPTMFLVDKARKIIAKPLTIIEMKELF